MSLISDYLFLKVQENIEWSFVTDHLIRRARSPLGKKHASDCRPFLNSKLRADFSIRLQECKVLAASQPMHHLISDLVDLTEVFDLAARSGVLSAEQIYQTGQWLVAVSSIGEHLRAYPMLAPELSQDFALTPKTPLFAHDCLKFFTAQGEILDHASSLLSELRRARSGKRVHFENKLKTKVKDWFQEGLLQDSYYDVLDGRYVVPLKIENQNLVDGITFGRSNSGQSVFIEPAEITAENNQLKELENKIKAEEYRILKDYSSKIASVSSFFIPWIYPVGRLDLLCAAAELSKDWNATPAIDSSQTSRDLKLIGLYHPSLIDQGVKIVKNSVLMRGGGSGILISGPNTGGKTVLLKSIALASVMAGSGLDIPAESGSQVPQYLQVVPLIGDGQNISTGLSSFSAQIKDLNELCAKKEDLSQCLIIIDEVLSSTDPEEASVLAQAYMEHFVNFGAHVLVSSHFSDLSLRLTTHQKIKVGAMEFLASEAGGNPTYQLRMGEVGLSHALTIAKKLKTPDSIIEKASSLLSNAKLDYEKAIEEVRIKEQVLKSEFENRYQKLQLNFEEQKIKLTSELHQKIEQALSSSRQQVAESLEQWKNRFETITKQGSQKSQQKIISASEELESKIKMMRESAEQALEDKPIVKKVFIPVVGVKVKVASMAGAIGEVLSIQDGFAFLQVGLFKVKKPFSDLSQLSENFQRHRTSYLNRGQDLIEKTTTKLDLRGKRFEQAMREAESFIDTAFRSGMPEVTVITGHGTGALKQGLRELLKGLPYVSEFEAEQQHDDGALVIRF